MGTWSTSLALNDTFADIYAEFYEYYNEGLSPRDAAREVVLRNQAIIDDPEDGHEMWFALAKAQWECGKLDGRILAKVTELIESGATLETWRELGVGERDIKSRQRTLANFLSRLRQKTLKPRARRKKRPTLYEPAFQKGDCLSFKMKSGNYGGIIVLETAREAGNPYTLFLASTTIDQKVEPTLRGFQRTSILTSKVDDFALNSRNEITQVERVEACVCWCTSDGSALVKKVAALPVDKRYSLDDLSGVMFSPSIDEAVIPRIEYLLSRDPAETTAPQALSMFTRESFVQKLRRLAAR